MLLGGIRLVLQLCWGSSLDSQIQFGEPILVAKLANSHDISQCVQPSNSPSCHHLVGPPSHIAQRGAAAHIQLFCKHDMHLDSLTRL